MNEAENNLSHPENGDEQTEKNIGAPAVEGLETENNKRAPAAKKRGTEKNIGAPDAKRGRPARETPEAAKWSLRGVEPETRTALTKAADKLGKTVGEFFNTDLRTYATEILQGQPSSPPAAPRDIEQMIEAKILTMGDTLSAKLSEHITNQMQAARPAEEPKKGLLARILGK